MLWPGSWGATAPWTACSRSTGPGTSASSAVARHGARGERAHRLFRRRRQIGYQYKSTLPVRKGGENPVACRRERRPRLDRLRSYERHPYDLNPKKGYTASFNQMPAVADYYGTAFFLFERAFRFDEMVNAKERFTVEEIRAMQNAPLERGETLRAALVAACAEDKELAPHAKRLRAGTGS